MLFPIHRGAVSLEDIERERQRITGLRSSLGGSPGNVGEGLAAMGRAIDMRLSQRRLDQQQGPATQGAPQQPSGLLPRIAEGMSGNTMPWQFPQAPQQPAAPQQPNPQMQGAPAARAAAQAPNPIMAALNRGANPGTDIGPDDLRNTWGLGAIFGGGGRRGAGGLW